MGPHNVKVGLFFEHTTRPARAHRVRSTAPSTSTATRPIRSIRIIRTPMRSSARSTATPESTLHPDADARFTNLEWFVQDNWRVKKNLTVDAGLRFYHIGPTDQQRRSAGGVPAGPIQRQSGAAVDSADQHVLTVVEESIRSPAKSCRRSKSARSCRTPAIMTNGVQVFDEGVLDTPSIQVAPRIGFSWDVTGDGKTAVRGGFGVFPDRFNDDIILAVRRAAADRQHPDTRTTPPSASCSRRR